MPKWKSVHISRAEFIENVEKNEFEFARRETAILALRHERLGDGVFIVPVTANVNNLKVDLFMFWLDPNAPKNSKGMAGGNSFAIEETKLFSLLKDPVVLQWQTTAEDWRTAIQIAFNQVWWCFLLCKSKTILTSKVFGTLTGTHNRIGDNIERGVNDLLKQKGYRSRIILVFTSDRSAIVSIY